MNLWEKFTSPFRRKKLDAEMAEEMREHMERRAQANLAAGMSADEARYAARRQFGGAEQLKEIARGEREWVWIERLVKDCGYAGRQMKRAPAFTAVAVLTLALCIGANTAIFSAVYALIIKPLPFPAPDRIVEIFFTLPKTEAALKGDAEIAQYLNYRENAQSLSEFGLWAPYEGMLGENAVAQRLHGARATTDLFAVLGLKPLIGQFFRLENSRPNEDKVVVLTQSLWSTQFHEDPGILGKTVRIDGETLTIVGVIPRAFESLDARVRFVRPLVWDPASADPQARDVPNGQRFQLFARLKPGAALALALAEVDTLEQRFNETAPPAWRAMVAATGRRLHIGLVQSERAQPLKSTLLLLQGGVVFVLLIGCVNVANLVLARANSRRSELAIRFSLGATRGMIARQLLIEALVLTTIGAALGLGFAWSATGIMEHYRAAMMAEAMPFTLDGPVLGSTLAVSVGAALVVSALPILHLRRRNLTEVIDRSSRSASGSASVRAISGSLIVGQVAVALVLLTGAGLLIHSFVNALAVKPGFEANGVVTGRIAIPRAHRFSDTVARTLRDRVEQALGEIPGVSSVAISHTLPFQAGIGGGEITLADGPLPSGVRQPLARMVTASPEYLETLRLRLVEGRFLERSDNASVVVDEDFARKYFPGRSAIGGHFVLGAAGVRPFNESRWSTIVGVVGNVPHGGVEDRSGVPSYYFNYRGVTDGLSLFLRTSRPTSDVIAVLREKLRAIDAAIALYDTGPLQSFVDASFNGRRVVMLLLGAFAGLALLLSALGVYGVLAYEVSQRTREIGVRGAIGASYFQIMSLIMRQGLWKIGVGLVIGLIGAVLLSRMMQSLLFELSATDPRAYGVAALVLLFVAGLGSYFPARRAAKIDPVVALRAE